MVIAYSKLTAQGRISVPAEIWRKLGIGPGSVLEWDETDGTLVVRRTVRYSSKEIHQALFETAPEPKTIEELKSGQRRPALSRRPSSPPR